MEEEESYFLVLQFGNTFWPVRLLLFTRAAEHDFLCCLYRHDVTIDLQIPPLLLSLVAIATAEVAGDAVEVSAMTSAKRNAPAYRPAPTFR